MVERGWEEGGRKDGCGRMGGKEGREGRRGREGIEEGLGGRKEKGMGRGRKDLPIPLLPSSVCFHV